jgi:hypothetical protein
VQKICKWVEHQSWITIESVKCLTICTVPAITSIHSILSSALPCWYYYACPQIAICWMPQHTSQHTKSSKKQFGLNHKMERFSADIHSQIESIIEERVILQEPFSYIPVETTPSPFWNRWWYIWCYIYDSKYPKPLWILCCLWSGYIRRVSK